MSRGIVDVLRFSANTYAVCGYDFWNGFGSKAALSGFRGVEFMFPYDNDIEVLKRSSGIIIWNIRLHNLPAGDWAAGGQ